MPRDFSGWGWFDLANFETEVRLGGQLDEESLARTFAKTFQGRNGACVLAHLRRITLERSQGPDATDAMLRHLEGQRQLVSYVLSLVERGGGRPVVTKGEMSSSEPLMENNDE